jgi:hypothetical protein
MMSHKCKRHVKISLLQETSIIKYDLFRRDGKIPAYRKLYSKFILLLRKHFVAFLHLSGRAG